MSSKSAPKLAVLPTRVPSVGETLVGKYVVEGVIGQGGMGIVLAARHVQLGSTVAIKLISPNDTRQAGAVERLFREAKLAAALRSEHVVRVYDVGTLDTGAPFLVMEYLLGQDLASLVQGRGPLPVGEAAELVHQACDAIAEAHAAGIVHRDLKPSNLFVTQRRDGTPVVKVLDFGISKLVKHDFMQPSTLTNTRSVMGSPHYMSPEQLRDTRGVDFRTDIWALGVIFHELLTGEPTFPGETLPAVCAAIVADAPKPLAQCRDDVPASLEVIIRRCLEKLPDDRFASVDALASAIDPYRRRAEWTMQLAVTQRFERSADLVGLTGAGSEASVTASRSNIGFDQTQAALAASHGDFRTRGGRRAFWLGGVGGVVLVGAAALLWPGQVDSGAHALGAAGASAPVPLRAVIPLDVPAPLADAPSVVPATQPSADPSASSSAPPATPTTLPAVPPPVKSPSVAKPALPEARPDSTDAKRGAAGSVAPNAKPPQGSSSSDLRLSR
jgi:serine/threonine-protein kinase